MRIQKISHETDFKKLLESKVDLNIKIAKILANALDWKISFNVVNGSKYSIAFPVPEMTINPDKI